jgi:hypothetical protein
VKTFRLQANRPKLARSVFKAIQTPSWLMGDLQYGSNDKTSLTEKTEDPSLHAIARSHHSEAAGPVLPRGKPIKTAFIFDTAHEKTVFYFRYRSTCRLLANASLRRVGE